MSKTLANNERLPDALAQNQVDLNHNGVPDYIDTLTASGGNNREFLEYSKRELASYNDSQKVPDSNPDHASIVSYDSDSGEISFLGLGGNKIDSINSSIDSLLSSLCNGFG
jgi:hypothetical protein